MSGYNEELERGLQRVREYKLNLSANAKVSVVLDDCVVSGVGTTLLTGGGPAWPHLRQPETLTQPVGPPPSIPTVAGRLTSPDDNHVITPETGTFTLTGYPAEFVVVRRPVVTPPTPAVLSWLDSVAAFIPKMIRDPFFGDLREDLVEKRAAGWSSTRLTWAAVSQVAILISQWFLTRRRS